MEKLSTCSKTTFLSPQRSWYRSKLFPIDQITEINFAQAKEQPDEQWAADALVSGSIVCQRCGSKLYLTGSHIALPPDCNHLFAGMTALKVIHGLDTLDTSCVLDLRYAFYEDQSLEEVRLAQWNLSQVTVTDNMFSDCYKLTQIHLGSGLRAIGERMFFRCLELKFITGLSQIATIGDRAFVYTPVLQHTDLQINNIRSIGDSACHLSAIEDGTDFSSVPFSAIKRRGTRAKRWSSRDLWHLSQTHSCTASYISIPNADCQKNYHGTYGHDASGVTYTVANGACRSFAIYHICNAYREKAKKSTYPSWESWWSNAIENQYAGAGTFAYTGNNMDSIRVLRYMLKASNLVLQRRIIIDASQKLPIINQLSAGHPIYCSIASPNTETSHAVVLHGYDPTTDRFALCDSSVCTPNGVTSWFKFEDIFLEANEEAGTNMQNTYLLIRPSKILIFLLLRKCFRKFFRVLRQYIK